MTRLKTAFAIILSSLCLAACQATSDPARANVYGSPFGQTVVGNKNGVLIGNVWNEMDAFPIAEKFCGQFGKAASYKSTQGYRAAYDCI